MTSLQNSPPPSTQNSESSDNASSIASGPVDPNLYEFSKALVSSAEYQYSKLLNPSSPNTLLPELLRKIPYIGQQLSVLTNYFQEIINENNKLALEHVLSSSDCGQVEQECKIIFRKILLLAAIEIWSAFEEHIKWVYRKVRKGIRSPLQGIKKLGQYAGSRCFKYLMEKATEQDVHLAVVLDLDLNDFIVAQYEQWTIDSLRIEWPGEEKIKLSAAKFFQYPFVAIAPSLKGLVRREEYKGKDYDKSVLVVKEDKEKCEDFGKEIKPHFFRRPFGMEQEKMQKEELSFVSVETLKDEEYFKWTDRSGVLDILYERIKDEESETRPERPQMRKMAWSIKLHGGEYGEPVGHYGSGTTGRIMSIFSVGEEIVKDEVWLKNELEKSQKYASRVGFGGICIIAGGHSCGKSTLVKKCFTNYEEEDYGEKIWMCAGTEDKLVWAFKRFAVEKLLEEKDILNGPTGFDEANLKNLLDKVYGWIAQQEDKTLIVFDNAYMGGEGSSGGIFKFIRSCPLLHLVITTRDKDFGWEIDWDTFVTSLD